MEDSGQNHAQEITLIPIEQGARCAPHLVWAFWRREELVAPC